MQVIKELKDSLFLLMIIELQLLVLIKLLGLKLIQIKNTSFQEQKIENCNIGIDGRNFYDQPINNLINQYDEVRKVSTGQCDDYATGLLLDFAYLKKITD